MFQIEAGVQELTREECLALIGTVPVGRLVFTDRAMPAVVPVNFVLDGEQIVVRTGVSSSLAAGVRGAVVAFEVDEVDGGRGVGWSVTVIGQAKEVREPLEQDRLAALPLAPYAGGRRNHFVVVPLSLVTGRRVGVGPLARTAQLVAQA